MKQSCTIPKAAKSYK